MIEVRRAIVHGRLQVRRPAARIERRLQRAIERQAE